MGFRYLYISALSLLILSILFPADTQAQLGAHIAAANERKKDRQEEEKAGMAASPEKYSEAGNFYILGQAGFLTGGLWKEGISGAEVSSSLYITAGYNFTHWFQTGIGAGYGQFGVVPLYPVFGEVRGLFSARDFSPYYAFRAGHSYAGYFDNENTVIRSARGGFMGEGQLGLSLRTGKLNFLLGGGYHYQKAELEGAVMDWWGGNQTFVEKRTYRRIAATCTLKFNF